MIKMFAYKVFEVILVANAVKKYKRKVVFVYFFKQYILKKTAGNEKT